MSRAWRILLGLLVLGLAVSPALAFCGMEESSCCCGTTPKPEDPCPVQCAFEFPDSSPSAAPKAGDVLSPLLVVVVAEVGPTSVSLFPSLRGMAIAVSDDFPESFFLSQADPTRAPPFCV